MSKIYSKEEIINFLRSVSVMSIALTMDGNPVSSVVLFHVDDSLDFYWVTRRDSYKAKAALTNPVISLSVWEHHKMLVQAKGDVFEIVDAHDIDDIIGRLASLTASIKDFWPPIVSIEGGEYVVFKIRTHWIRALDLSDIKIRDKEMFSEYHLT